METYLISLEFCCKLGRANAWTAKGFDGTGNSFAAQELVVVDSRQRLRVSMFTHPAPRHFKASIRLRVSKFTHPAPRHFEASIRKFWQCWNSSVHYFLPEKSYNVDGQRVEDILGSLNFSPKLVHHTGRLKPSQRRPWIQSQIARRDLHRHASKSLQGVNGTTPSK